ncbi:MAG TPA: gluconate 5-dehydrogenase [Succinivibrionaceae bacterium]|nr:glucose 1-dehydrogenase [Succinivibrio sp.]HAR80532.1 gluconate 5-dehydrogenase [Succinivibrionaceae bacterium]
MILEGKTALISGGSRGIGRAIAELFYKEGANIYIMSRNPDQLGQAAEEIDTKKENRVHAVPCDVGSKTSVDEAFARIKADGACIDVLVNCAGVNLRGPLETMPLDTWNKVLGINLTGTFLLTQNCFEMMKSKGGGKIVNIASLMSEIARPTISPYVASKGGVKMFTKAIAIEWAKYNIQANAIIPGYIATEMNTPLIEDKKFNQFIIDRTPAGRWGQPEEVAHAALFFASKGADFITGQLIAVDGGILAAL